MDVGLEGEAPAAEREVGERLVHGSSRVVDQDVDVAPQGRGCFRDDPAPVVLVGQIGHDDGDPGAVPGDAGRRLLQAPAEMIVLGAGPSGDGHVGTLGGQPFGLPPRCRGWRR